MSRYYSVLTNRDTITLSGVRTPVWELLGVQPYGWLTSLAYARADVPPDTPMIWDCGAWSYKALDVPRLRGHDVTPAWAAWRYDALARPGDLVVAPDHMLTRGDLDYRRCFNAHAALAFLGVCPDRLTPVAVCHGLSRQEYARRALELTRLGYAHLAVGGVAGQRGGRAWILEVVRSVREAAPGAHLHVLGLSSPSYALAWHTLGVDSYDGSSHYKQAFTAGAFFTREGAVLLKHQAVKPGEAPTAPLCHCFTCALLRGHGIDTRTYGSGAHNIGRAAHNLSLLMEAHEEVVRTPRPHAGPRQGSLFPEVCRAEET